MIRRFLTVFAGGMGIALGITGLQLADNHEPTLANALAGQTLYSDAGTIRILSTIVLVLSIVLLIWEFVRGSLPTRDWTQRSGPPPRVRKVGRFPLSRRFGEAAVNRG